MNSGVYIKTKRGIKDLLELTDEEFVNLIANELSAFTGKRKVSDALRERVLASYMLFVKKNKDRKDWARVSAIMALEDMGRRFSKYLSEWERCLSELNIKGKTQG